MVEGNSCEQEQGGPQGLTRRAIGAPRSWTCASDQWSNDFRRADVQRATPAGRSSCRTVGGIVEFFYVQVLGTLAAVLFVALPVLAVLPACSTSWRRFSLSLSGFAVGLVVFLVCAVVSLDHTKRGEGPAVFGIGFQLLAVGAIFFASWAIRLLVVVAGALLSSSSAAKRPSRQPPAQKVAADPPLHLAAWSGDLERARSLVRGGANVNERDSSGETPIYRAVEWGHAEMVRYLADAGAELGAPMPNRSSPLHRAAGWGTLETVTLLVQAGADVQALDEAGSTPEQVARERGKHEIASYLGNAQVVHSFNITA